MANMITKGDATRPRKSNAGSTAMVEEMCSPFPDERYLGRVIFSPQASPCLEVADGGLQNEADIALFPASQLRHL